MSHFRINTVLAVNGTRGYPPGAAGSEARSAQGEPARVLQPDVPLLAQGAAHATLVRPVQTRDHKVTAQVGGRRLSGLGLHGRERV